MSQCLGECGRDGVQTNASGICAKCALERRLAGASAHPDSGNGAAGLTENVQTGPRVKRAYKRRGEARPDEIEIRMCGRGCGERSHRGMCKGENRFSREKAPDGGGRLVKGATLPGLTNIEKAPDGAIEQIRTLREALAAECEKAGQEYARLQCKLETFDEILEAL